MMSQLRSKVPPLIPVGLGPIVATREATEGAVVGDSEGVSVGRAVVGNGVGGKVGKMDGKKVGHVDGTSVGSRETGHCDGEKVTGVSVGVTEGHIEGISVGSRVTGD